MAATAEGSRTPFHVIHKLPAGDGLYFRAKHSQLVEKNPEKAISLFRASLAAGDCVDSALKDVAVALKQLNRPDDAILAISAFRSRCSESAQDSLANLLLDLYKSSGWLNDQIALLNRKLKAFQNDRSFNGQRTKTARSQGKKFQVSVDQEVARLLKEESQSLLPFEVPQTSRVSYKSGIRIVTSRGIGKSALEHEVIVNQERKSHGTVFDIDEGSHLPMHSPSLKQFVRGRFRHIYSKGFLYFKISPD